MATKSRKQQYYGIFYVSNGRWTGPYEGKTYTIRGLTREPLKSYVRWYKNHLLKSRILIRPVQKAK